MGGAAESHSVYYGEEWSPCPLPSVPVSDQRESQGWGLMLRLQHGNSHTQRSLCGGRAPMGCEYVPGVAVSGRETLWVSRGAVSDPEIVMGVQGELSESRGELP